MKKSNVYFIAQMWKIKLKLPRILPENVYSLNINYRLCDLIASFGVIFALICILLKAKPYLCSRIFNLDLSMNELTGADFKSATADDSKKLFIETYGCQMNVADKIGRASCRERV